MFGERIKELRLANNLSKNQLGKIIGISGSNVNIIEKGTTQLRLKKTIKLADYFDVSVDYLLGRTDNPELNKLSSGISTTKINSKK